MSSVRYDQLNRLARAEYYDNMDVSDNEWETTGSMLAAYRNTFTYDANGNILTQNRHGHATTVNMDSMTYHYQSGTNKLTYVDDVVSSGNYDDDIDDQSSGNYTYDEIGNMISDAAEQIAAIEWTVYGKIKSITRTGGSSKSNLAFEYSPDGHRVMKTETPNGGSGTPTTTWYIRDAQGNTMAIYEERNDSVWLDEQEIYGSSRVGMVKKNLLLNSLSLDTVNYQIKRGEKRYELSNHLGNVLAVISDKLNRVCNNDTVSYFNAEVMFAYDYSPFGAILPQRSYAADSSCTTVIDYDTAYNDHYEVTFTLTTLLSPGQTISLDNGNGTNVVLATYNAGYVNVLSYKGQIIANVSPAADGIIYITQSGATLKLRFSADSLGFDCGDVVRVYSGHTSLTSVSIDCAVDSIFAVDTITVCNSSDYRFGFNGMEKDNEVHGTGNSYDFGARIYDSRLGRWMSLDPEGKTFPGESHFIFVGNNPLYYYDLEGKLKITPSVAKAYPNLAKVVKNIHTYILNNTELKTELYKITGAKDEDFNRIFKNNSTSPLIMVSDMSVGILGESHGTGPTDGDGNLADPTITLDKSFLEYMEKVLSNPNSTEENKKAALLSITILLVHEGTHLLYAQAEGGTSDANKFDENYHDIGYQLEEKVYKTPLLYIVNEKVGEINGDKEKVNEFALEASKTVIKDNSVSEGLKDPLKK